MNGPLGPPELADLSPSCEYIYRRVDEDGPVTVGDILENTYLAESTTHDALTRLEDAGIITSRDGPAGKTLYDADT